MSCWLGARSFSLLVPPRPSSCGSIISTRGNPWVDAIVKQAAENSKITLVLGVRKLACYKTIQCTWWVTLQHLVKVIQRKQFRFSIQTLHHGVLVSVFVAHNSNQVSNDFAIHPQSLGLPPSDAIDEYEVGKKGLNALPLIDSVETMHLKNKYIRLIYALQKHDFLCYSDFTEWFKEEQIWLVPFALYRLFTDINGTSDYDRWGDSSNLTPE